MTLNDKVQVGDSTTSTSTSTTTSQWQTYNHYKAEQGWECPRCGRINAPWVRQCDCSHSNWTITWSSDHVNFDPDWYEKVTCADNVLNNPNTYSTIVGGSDYYNPSTCTYKNTTRNINNATDGKHYQGSTYTCKKI